MKKTLLSLILSVALGMHAIACTVANDNCSTATSLGTLPAPPACGGNTSGFKYGTLVTLAAQSNTCATAEAPYPYQYACPITLSSPPRDVWYSFVASSTSATIAVTGASFSNPVVDVWSGTCGQLTAQGCNTGTGGAATVTVYQLTVGATYFIQVAGEDSAQAGTFTLTAQASTNCAGCLVSSHVTATPPPVNGAYPPGQNVQFCYEVTDYYQTNDNWLHGVTVAFGSGWDTTTFMAVSVPPACSGSSVGYWKWYNGPIGDSSTATGNVYGPGFYFESNEGSPLGVEDNLPGDNFGDNNISNCSWTFCVSITSSNTSCIAGDNLSVSFSTTGDGQSGSWNSPGCNGDPTVPLSSVGACCPPAISTTSATCNHNDGTATAYPTGANGPWKFTWSNGVVQNNDTGTSTITGLVVGLYTVTMTDIFGCESTVSDSVRPTNTPNGGGTKYVSCPQQGDSAIMTAVGQGNWYSLANIAPTTIVSPDSAHTAITGFSAIGTYYYVWEIGNCLDTVPVIVTLKPNAGPDQNACTDATVMMGAYGTGVWSAFPNNPAPTRFADANFDSTTVTGFTQGGVYSFVWTTSAGCSDTMTVTVPFFNISLSASSTSICQYSNTSITVTPTTAAYAPFYITWLDSTLVQDPHSATTFILSLDTTKYFHVQVTDAGGCTLTDSILISTTSLVGNNIRASANPTIVCPGNPTQLVVVANPNSCGLATGACSGAPTTVLAGTGNSLQSGPAFQYPSPYGNFYFSAHHQFLIQASELQSQVPGGGQINSLSLDVGTLYANTLDNFTISMACVPNDSIDHSFLDLGGLTQVFTVASYSVVAGWNTHIFPVPYDWDGSSNLLVDICFTNTSSSTDNPKMRYTTTPFKSVWCVYDNVRGGECGVQGGQSGPPLANSVLFERPNMKLDMCFNNLTGANLTWTPGTGPNAPTPDNLDTVTAHPVATTDYIVALTNPDGCVSYSSVMVTVDTAVVLSISPSPDTSLCSSSPVHITTTVTPGAGVVINPDSIFYKWKTEPATAVAPDSGWGATFADPTVTATSTTTYILTISGPGLCAITDSTIVIIGTGLPVRAIVDSITCSGTNDGKIVIDMNAGTAPYTYIWSPGGATIDSIMNLGPGTYYVTVTDAGGCRGKDTFTLTVPVISVSIDSTPISCYNANDGTLTATATGGTAQYNYTWTPGGNGNHLTNLGPGMYIVNVTDAHGCPAADTAYLGQPTQVTATIISTDSVICDGGGSGFANILAAGGRPPYTYTWSGSNSVDSFANNLTAGTQTVTVKDATGCTASATFTIYQPAPVSLVSLDTIAATCPGINNGKAIALATGGTAPYTYTFDGSGILGVDSVTGLAPGPHVLEIIDSRGCVDSVGDIVFTTGVQYTLAISMTSDNASCFGYTNGAAYVTALNGSPAYSYQWSPSASTLDSATGLGAGPESVTVTDMYGCTATGAVTITQPAAPTLVYDSINPLCSGQATGKFWIVSVNGVPVSQTTGLSYTFNGTFHQITDTASNLSAATYTAIVTYNANGCTAPLTVSLANPSPLSISPSVTGISCANDANGIIQLNASGGTPPYTYAWSSGGYTGSQEDSLAPGSYTITVSDANACTVSYSSTLIAPPAITAGFEVDSTSCPGAADGQITVNADGGTPGNTVTYTYALNGGAYQFDNHFFYLLAGTYQIAVRDSPGCVFDTFTTVYQPDAITAYINPQDSLIAPGTSIQLFSVIGNITTQTVNSYSWSPSVGLSCIDCPNPVASPYQTTEYYLTVNYGKGCVVIDSSLIQVGHGAPVYIPNAFTPNGDGRDDYFTVYGTTLYSVGMKIFDRWGEKVFDSGDSQWASWDGTYRGVMQEPGMFVYYVQLTFIDGSQETREGSITLIR